MEKMTMNARRSTPTSFSPSVRARTNAWSVSADSSARRRAANSWKRVNFRQVCQPIRCVACSGGLSWGGNPAGVSGWPASGVGLHRTANWALPCEWPKTEGRPLVDHPATETPRRWDSVRTQAYAPPFATRSGGRDAPLPPCVPRRPGCRCQRRPRSRTAPRRARGRHSAHAEARRLGPGPGPVSPLARVPPLRGLLHRLAPRPGPRRHRVLAEGHRRQPVPGRRRRPLRGRCEERPEPCARGRRGLPGRQARGGVPHPEHHHQPRARLPRASAQARAGGPRHRARPRLSPPLDRVPRSAAERPSGRFPSSPIRRRPPSTRSSDASGPA